MSFSFTAAPHRVLLSVTSIPLTDGTLELQVNGAGYRLEKGEGILINRNFVHITTGLTDGGQSPAAGSDSYNYHE